MEPPSWGHPFLQKEKQKVPITSLGKLRSRLPRCHPRICLSLQTGPSFHLQRMICFNWDAAHSRAGVFSISPGGPAGFRVAEGKWPAVKQRKYQGILIEQIVYFPPGGASKALGPSGDNVWWGHQSPNGVSGPFTSQDKHCPGGHRFPTGWTTLANWRRGLWHQHTGSPCLLQAGHTPYLGGDVRQERYGC